MKIKRTKHPTLREELHEAHARNRRLSGIVTHWQNFAAQIGTILNCGSIDEDIIVALKKLKRQVRQQPDPDRRMKRRTCPRTSTGR
jgi:hypothetical protein